MLKKNVLFFSLFYIILIAGNVISDFHFIDLIYLGFVVFVAVRVIMFEKAKNSYTK